MNDGIAMNNGIAKDFEEFILEFKRDFYKRYNVVLKLKAIKHYTKTVTFESIECNDNVVYNIHLQSCYKKIGGRRKRAYTYYIYRGTNFGTSGYCNAPINQTYIKKNFTDNFFERFDLHQAMYDDKIVTEKDEMVKDIIV